MPKSAHRPRNPWELSSSSDPKALAVVDGLGKFARHGPHYSRRTPGSKTFTGVGREIVLVATTGDAVWAVVYQKTPARRGTGLSRGRAGVSETLAIAICAQDGKSGKLRAASCICSHRRVAHESAICAPRS